MDIRDSKKTKIIKRERPAIKKHKATIYILVNKYECQVSKLDNTDKALVIKSDKELSSKEWLDVMREFQLILDEAFKNV